MNLEEEGATYKLACGIKAAVTSAGASSAERRV
jgi:hypothetical protein